eukprot:3724957-Amphidinium_carterae.1
MIELVAPVLVQRALLDLFKGRRSLLIVDSEATLGALVKGYSSRSDLCELVSLFWLSAAELDVCWYLDRVPNDANPADGPSRNELDDLVARGAKRVRLYFNAIGAMERLGLGGPRVGGLCARLLPL